MDERRRIRLTSHGHRLDEMDVQSVARLTRSHRLAAPAIGLSL